ncbi:hypothetical protein C6P46_003600 [Rhodotorula mucilaginosa]|uniref:GDP-fucose protein O-fucosyltransferase n=1 Tax=Rhodotorula mucilaginosa TaxID=5537 RepID=A0A9P6W8F2_RHOMI|nr:hypothetical protein C6P46_003600 [Rhodotorula mucilaginosa]
MARYIELPTSRKDAEEHSHDEQGSALPYAASDSYSQAAGDRESSTSNRRVVALFGAGLLLLVVLSTGYHWANWVRTPRTFFGPPPSKHLEIDLRRGNVPGPAELLTSAAPAASYRKALRPELRADSFNGWTGHVLAAFSLLYLAQLTQRVAILPSFGNEFHYGNSMITLGHLYDMDRFRRERGALFVDWVDVKPLDPGHNLTETDDIGCYMGNNEFEAGTSFDKFNLARSIWRVDRSTPFPNSIESFVLWDYDEKRRISETKTFAQTRGYTLPSNMLESGSTDLLCYGNIWALAHASARARGWSYFSGHVPELQHESGGLLKMMDPSVRGMWPEWYSIGQYIDFTPKVWDIAIDCVKRTLRTNRIPKHLITVHLRRGDFKSWCPAGQRCVPTVERYSEQVDKFLSDSPSDTRVLVTTDEQDDADFLASVDDLGWFRIDHRHLGTADVLRAEYGETWRWADAAVDQAILSLGMAFVGTADSQVSVISELRVATWNGGRTHLVKRPT